MIGVPRREVGRGGEGLVVLREGKSLTEEQVLAHCKTKLGGMKAPKTVEFRREIAKTPAGKIDRKELRRPYWAGVERGVH